MSIENILMAASESLFQQRRRNQQRLRNRRDTFTLLFITCIIIAVSNSYAKYVKKTAVDAPIDSNVANYYMDVISDDGSQVKLSEQLDLKSINPGEFQAISFIVRNAEKQGEAYNIADVDMLYSIDIYHTENLPLKYDLYQYMGEDENGAPIYQLMFDYLITDTNDINNYYNSGEIQKYKDDVYNNFLELKAKIGEVTQQKFKLVITWENEGEIQIDNKFVNEVDLAYLVITGIQKE